MTTICSWCSTEVADGVTVCPSCGANLVADGDPNVPGVTAVDAASIIRSKSTAQPRSRLLSWISGEYQTDVPSKSEQQAIAPPDLEVRREILRLELEAEVANLQAEADALRAEAAAEGRALELPEADAGSEETADAVTAPAEAADAPASADVVDATPGADGDPDNDAEHKATA